MQSLKDFGRVAVSTWIIFSEEVFEDGWTESGNRGTIPFGCRRTFCWVPLWQISCHHVSSSRLQCPLQHIFNYATIEMMLCCHSNHRILFHLQKCRRNYAKAQRAKGLEVEYGYCKFNYVHHLPLIELQFHESRCEDQYSVLQHIAYHSSGKETT